MNRAALFIARLYILFVLRNPVVFVAMGSAIIYAAFEAMNGLAALREIQLTCLEAVYLIQENALFHTYGLFVPFLVLISPLLSSKDLERIVAFRASRRTDLWVAKVLAIAVLAVFFLAVPFLLILIAASLHHSPALMWSEAFLQLAESSDGSVTGIFAHPAFPSAVLFLIQAHRPWSVLVLQGLLFLVSFVLSGMLGAVLADLLRRPALALMLVVVFWVSALVPPGTLPFIVSFLSPETHLLLVNRSLFSYLVSFQYLVPASVLVFLLGQRLTTRAVLG
ncbi:MAG: hypothetical protein KM312_10635 [Hydrogenibacillus schlegelii]|uniref:Uncharacterized protein n=1 Tax=Hydrogenibacillus schlegelii TaxID=1484 RepID=A0A947D2W2_HYDSH|nr:hypothetical protein [Hydrogenibacillus schlegelii]